MGVLEIDPSVRRGHDVSSSPNRADARTLDRIEGFIAATLAGAQRETRLLLPMESTWGRESGEVLAGYHGRYVRVDAATGMSSAEALAPETLSGFVGGVGLGTWILAIETEPGIDPLAEQSALVFALSPLVGTPLTTSSKFALVAISPLTGRLCDALSSSHFALGAKRAGVDAIVITGRRAEPSIVFIEGDAEGALHVVWLPAGALWGLPAGRPKSRSAPVTERTGKWRRLGRRASA